MIKEKMKCAGNCNYRHAMQRWVSSHHKMIFKIIDEVLKILIIKSNY